MRPASVLHVRLPFVIILQQPEAQFPGERGRAFVTEQTTQLVLPSHIEAVAEAAAAATGFVQNCGLGEREAFGIDMAVREAVTNAIVHGNQEDEAKAVEVTFNCLEHALEIEVKDQGEGFNLANVPDPTDPANILKTSGRGIFLIRSFMDEVQWLMRPDGGTTVRMVKRF
jgi:serine/threonine-protein kinase RsbW